MTLPSTTHGPAAKPVELTDFLHEKLALLWRGKWIIASCLALSLAAVSAYLLTTRPLYEATVQLLVLKQGGRPLSSGGDHEPVPSFDRTEDFLPTQMQLLGSPRVVGQAIEDVGLENLPTLKDAVRDRQDPVATAIKKYLTVTRPDRNAMILKVDYRSWSPEESKRMAKALVASYAKFLESHYQQNNSKVVELIGKARDELRIELEELERKHLEALREHPILTSDEAGRNFLSHRLERWDMAVKDATIKALSLRSQLDTARKLEKQGAGMISVAYALNQLGGDTAGGLAGAATGSAQGASSEYVRQLVQKQQQVADKLGPNFSRARDLQDQIQKVLEHSRDTRKRVEKVEIDDLVASIDQSLQATESNREELSRLFDKDMAEAKEFAAAQAAESHLRANLQRQRDLFHTVVDQLKQAQLGGDYSNISAEVVEPPNASDKPVSPRLTRTLAAGLMVGLIAGAGGAFLLGTWDLRIRSSADLRRVADVAILGRIPEFTPFHLATAGSAGRVSEMLPRSLPAEAYKQLRTSLELLRRGRDARIVMITSPTIGDGKSVTASNLAISLAHAGRSVLLVDADLRHPSLHVPCGAHTSSGLVQILKGMLPLSRVVQRTAIANLDFVAVGPPVPNPAELLMTPSLRAFLDDARSDYDVVIVDASPLLAVTDPSIIASSVDAILLVVRACRSKRADVSRAMEILDTIGTPLLGTVVNGIDPKLGAGFGPSHGYHEHYHDGAHQPAAGEKTGEAHHPESTNGVPSAPVV